MSTTSSSLAKLQSSAQSRGPPEPVYILRGHPSQIHVLEFWRENKRLVSGDADGWVVVWSISSRRPVVSWKAHEGALLAVKAWGDDTLITHGRDNKLFVWKLSEEDEASLDKFLPTDIDEYKLPSCRKPELKSSLDVNALNFCGFAICEASEDGDGQERARRKKRRRLDSEMSILVALPGLTDSDKIDVWKLPESSRVHAAIGTSNAKTGMAMGLDIFHHPEDMTLNVAAGFESGHVCLFRERKLPDGFSSWDTIFTVQPHTQPSLSVAVSLDCSLLISTSADAIICKLAIPNSESSSEASKKLDNIIKKVDTKHSGQQSVRIRDDGKIFATAGWDSKIRVYSGKTCKELAVLKWHREGCYGVAIADTDVEDKEEIEAFERESGPVTLDGSSYKTLEQKREEREASRHWIAGGAKDGKISLWEIY